MFGSRLGILAGFTFLALLGTARTVSAAPGDPVAMIKKKDAELQKMLRDKAASKQTDRLKVLINGIFDFEELGRRALGPEIWKTMTPDQQARFVKAFKGMVENASVKKLEAYQSDSTTYDAPEITDGKANVTSHVFSKGTESIVTYKLQARDTTWKAWDLIIDDLSTARNYGEQFRKILQTSDMNGLIAKLEKKGSGVSDAKTTDSMKAKSEKGAAAPKAPAKSGTTAKAKATAPSSTAPSSTVAKP
jgi:phospholipid transport system substrate-binding protein